MKFLNLSWIDYALFVVMFVLSAAVGLYFGCFGKQQATTNDYLLGGKNMKVFPVAMSLVASTLSGLSLLGIPAEIYMHGTQFWMIIIPAFFMGFINRYIYLPVFCKLQLTSVYEYLQIRFDKHTSTIASILYTLTNFMYLPMVIYAPALAFNQVTGFSLHIIATVMSLICISYTTMGGLKAVVWTDTLQFSVTLCTLGCVLIMGTISVGGFSVIWEKAELGSRIEFFNMNPDPTLRATFWSVVLGNLFHWSAFFAINPAAVQRFLAVPTFKDSITALVIFMVFTIITKSISCFSGLIMYAKYFDCDPLSAKYIRKADQILPYYVLDVAAQVPGLSGLFVAGLFSTALSTLSTYLNTVSGIMYTDFLAPFMPKNTSEKTASNIMKILTAAIGLTCVALIFVLDRLGSIVELMISLNGITSGPLLGLFTLGMLFPFANRKGALCGVLVSLVFMFLVVIKNLMHVWNHNIRYMPKPLFTYGCNITSNVTETYSTTTTVTTDDGPEKPLWLYRISFHYYVLMGTMLTIIIGLLVSWITKDSEDSPVDLDLLSPCIHRFVRKSAMSTRYESVETNLQVFELKENNSVKD